MGVRVVVIYAVLFLATTGCRKSDLVYGASPWDSGLGENDSRDDGSPMKPLDGVDILVVVDNSGSMDEEQQMLSRAFFELINGLTFPLEGKPVDTIRLGVTTTDLGLQYGWDGATAEQQVNSCTHLQGDDGALMTGPDSVTSIPFETDDLTCLVDDRECPPGSRCSDGVCVGHAGDSWSANCVPLNAGNYAEWSDNLNLQAACLVMQGTEGCGVEQQLAASVHGAMNNPGFLVDTHLLQVIVVSDEEDCSVEDDALYATPEWLSGPGEFLNIACNYPPANEENLFEIGEIREKLIASKGGRGDDLFFAAIVGVPLKSTCQGRGNTLSGCLDEPEMALTLDDFTMSNGNPFTHFVPACVRFEANVEVTSARPGRRFVQMAEAFGENGYVFSICNEDWSPFGMVIAAGIRHRLSAR